MREKLPIWVFFPFTSLFFQFELMLIRREDKISILVSDTSDLVGELSFKVGLFDNFNIVGLVDNSEKTIRAYKRLVPDVLLLGNEIQPISGIQICEHIRNIDQNANIIITTKSESSTILTKAINAGARGICLKETEPDRLRIGLECINDGEIWIDEHILDPFLRDAPFKKLKQNAPSNKIRLTDRELSILKLVASGYSNKRIGQQLYLSAETVKFHLTRIKKRLNASDRTEAAVIAVRANLV